MTLDSIIEMLNHNNKVIDILKMDVEGAEWKAFQQMLASGVLKRVRQLYIETHSG